MRNLVIAIVSALILTACDKPYVIDASGHGSKIVIEGLLTNRPGGQYVKLTRTADFYNSGGAPRITTASVIVNDDLGNEFPFQHKADSAGYYFPVLAFVGEIGRTYHLTVVVDGQTFEAEDKLVSVIPIDKLEYEIDKEEQEDPEEEDKFYEILVFAKEPQETKDYYLFKFYRNDSLKFDSDTDIYYSDDELLAENIDGVESPNYYGIGDVAKVEAYSLSRSGYIFYSDLQQLLNNDGGLFSSPPANCRTNLSNGAIGFFQVSALNSSEIKVE
jgi:hypothetical protein